MVKNKTLLIYPPHRIISHVNIREFGFEEYVEYFRNDVNIDILDLNYLFFGAMNTEEGVRENLDVDWNLFEERKYKKRLVKFLVTDKLDFRIQNAIEPMISRIATNYDNYIIVIAFPQQTSIALCISKFLKKKTKARIIIARPIHNSYFAIPPRLRELIKLNFVDIVVNRFEKNVIDLLKGDKDIKEIHSIAYKSEGRIFYNTTSYEDDIQIKDLPPPKYEHLIGKKVKYLFYEIARGCIYDCFFCLHSNQKINFKPVKKVVKELKMLQSKFNCSKFQFICPNITFSEKYVMELCGAIIECGLNIEWASFATLNNLDEKIVPMLAKSGAKLLDMGLETPKLSDINRNKIRDIDEISKKLRLLKKNNIKTYLSFITGRIDFEFDEDKQIIKFLLRNKDLIDITSMNSFEIHELNLNNIRKLYPQLRIYSKFLLDRRYYVFDDARFKSYSERIKKVDDIEKNIKKALKNTNILHFHCTDYRSQVEEKGTIDEYYLHFSK